MKLNKSFARRIGKSLSQFQQDLLANELPKFLLGPLCNDLTQKRYIAEIGIGMGDHFIARAAAVPDAIHIGFEPYLNGVANSLKLALEQNVTNILLWPDDVDLILDKLPDSFLDELYILFPDPWPKLRHHKRRIINAARLKLFASKLKPQGLLHFGSDIDHYFDSARSQVIGSGYFEEISASAQPPKGYIKTRYHMKAEEESRTPRFLHARKRCSSITE